MFKVIVTPGNNSGLVKKVLLQRGNWQGTADSEDLENQLPKAHFIWTPNSLPLRYYHIADESVRTSGKTLILNHFQNHRVITTKANLIRTLRNYYVHQESAYKANYNVFLTTPTTFILSVGNQDREYHEFIQRHSQLEKDNYVRQKVTYINVMKVPAKHCKENIWLVKPANMNQGRGIEVLRTVKQIVSFLGNKPLNSLWVVQKYIQKPLLYYGRKFDIRVWVIVTGKCEVYFYKKGYIRTSSDEYSLDKSNNYIHLTNNCLQKFGSGYSKFQQGNTLPLQTLQTYINSLEQYKDLGFDLERDIVTRMKDMIVDTIVAGKKSFLGRKREFELFGYDFMIDEDIRTWLIEVNTNPYLGVPNDYIKDLLNRMLDDMLKIVVDPIFPPKNKDIYSAENDFLLLYSEDPLVNTRSPFTKPVYPLESLAQYPNRKKEQAPANQAQEKRTTFKEYNVNDHIKQLITSYPFGDYDNFIKPVGRLLSEILNWELQSQQTHSNHSKTLKTLFQSKFSGVLLNDKFIPMLVKMIDSQSFPTQIQTVVIEGVNGLCRSVQTKVKIATPQMVNSLVKIALSMFDDKEFKKFDKALIKAAVNCLMALAGVYGMKYFIPGQTRENEAVKELFIRQGGLSVLLLASEQQDFRQQIQQFLNNLSRSDWQKQLLTLKDSFNQTRQSNKSFKNTPQVQHASITMHKDSLVDQVQCRLQDQKEKIERRQREMRERRQKMEEEQQRAKQEKERIDREKKMRAEEYMRKKNLERMKMKEEEEKKVAELKALEEERRKKLIEDMAKRREQLAILRNQSIARIQKQKQKQKSKEKAEKERQKPRSPRQRSPSVERKKILSEWIEAKKQKARQKRLEQRKQQLLALRQESTKKKILMVDRTLYLPNRNTEPPPKDKDPLNTSKIQIVHSAKVTSQGKRPQIKPERQISVPSEQNTKNHKYVKMSPIKHPATSIAISDDQGNPKTDKLPTSIQKVKTLRFFMNVIKRTIKHRNRDRSMFQMKKQSNFPSTELQDLRLSDIKQVQNPSIQTISNEKRQKTKAVIQQILASPYSSFVKANHKLIFDEVSKLV